MRLFLTNQESRFPHHLQALKKENVMSYDRAGLKEKVTRFSLETTITLQELNTDFLFDYQLFPEPILIGYGDWKQQGRPMKTGDTIVQQAHLPPLKRGSVKIIFGVRISEIIREPVRIGFSYETLEGHVECGISTFLLEQADGKIVFSIHTFSKPGNVWTRLVASIFTVPYQAYCTRAAGRRVIRQLQVQLIAV
jgi:uncharacterized protein (UPF0548 family)